MFRLKTPFHTKERDAFLTAKVCAFVCFFEIRIFFRAVHRWVLGHVWSNIFDGAAFFSVRLHGQCTIVMNESLLKSFI